MTFIKPTLGSLALLFALGCGSAGSSQQTMADMCLAISTEYSAVVPTSSTGGRCLAVQPDGGA